MPQKLKNNRNQEGDDMSWQLLMWLLLLSLLLLWLLWRLLLVLLLP